MTRVLYQINTPGGVFDATFVVWSPMTRLFESANFNSTRRAATARPRFHTGVQQ